MLKEILNNKKYISYMGDKNKDSYNVSKLLGRDLSQSQSIKFGTIFQEIVKNLASIFGADVSIEHYIDVYKTGNKNNKGKKDVDVLFFFNDTLYYFECKTNLDLDSEKSKATDNKVVDISKYLSEKTGMKVVSGVLNCWYKKESRLPVKVKNVFFMSDLFDILGYKCSENEYYSYLKDFGKSI